MNSGIKRVFNESGYSAIKYFCVDEIKHSKEIITASKLDLMILSGYSKGNHPEFYQLTVNNHEIPSILLIANFHQGIMDSYAYVPPPNHTCYFGELGYLNKEKIDRILNGKNLE